VEETGVHGENHRPVANRWQSLSHNVVSSTPRLSGFRTHNVGGDSTLTNDLIKTCTTKYTCSKGHNMFDQSVNPSLCIYGPCNRETWSFVYPQKSYYKGHKLFIIPKLHTQQKTFFKTNLTFYSICVVVYIYNRKAKGDNSLYISCGVNKASYLPTSAIHCLLYRNYTHNNNTFF
jgi:hypothetical protein